MAKYADEMKKIEKRQLIIDQQNRGFSGRILHGNLEFQRTSWFHIRRYGE